MVGEEENVASAANRELTALVVAVGQRMGFGVATEYVVPGGRLDVVWTWTPPSPVPGLHDDLPVVGFEIESSWRTRKHVKGDLLNLQDAGVALGVIVLADGDARDASLRRFAVDLVDRPGTRILVWTHDDVRALAEGRAGSTAVAEAAATLSTPGEVPGSAVTDHTGKYRALWEWLTTIDRTPRQVGFREVERILGFPLPESCRAHDAHWYSYEGSAVARAIIDAGWHAAQVSRINQTLQLVPGPPPRRTP